MGLNFETKFENFTINVMTVRATLQVAISLLPSGPEIQLRLGTGSSCRIEPVYEPQGAMLH